MLAQLFTSFFTIGLFAFGGGYVILSFLRQEVEQHGWMTAEQFVDFIAIAQSTPGPIAINMATFVGFQVAGLPGALVATGAVVLPGTVLIILLARFFLHFYERPAVRAAFLGLRPVVVGLIAAVTWQIGQVSIVNVPTLAIAAVTVFLSARWKPHPVLLILGSAPAGILFL
jgi:chromate transporter